MRQGDAIRVFACNLRRGDTVRLAAGLRRRIHGVVAVNNHYGQPGEFVQLLYPPREVHGKPERGVVIAADELVDVLL